MSDNKTFMHIFQPDKESGCTMEPLAERKTMTKEEALLTIEQYANELNAQ